MVCRGLNWIRWWGYFWHPGSHWRKAAQETNKLSPLQSQWDQRGERTQLVQTTIRSGSKQSWILSSSRLTPHASRLTPPCLTPHSSHVWHLTCNDGYCPHASRLTCATQVPGDIPGKNRRKGRDYEVDLLTGERIYKNGPLKKSAVCTPSRLACISTHLMFSSRHSQ